MRTYNTTLCVIAGMLLLGCIPSIHPLFTPDDLAFDPDLLGTWGPEDGDGTMVFTKVGEKGYRLVFTEANGKSDTFRVHLTKIDGRLFLDFAPDEEAELPHTDFYKVHLVPAHTFALVNEISPTSLEFSLLDPEWLTEYLKEHPDALKHEWRKEEALVLTAATKDLRKFFATHAKTNVAFAAEPSKFVRPEDGKASQEGADEGPDDEAEDAAEDSAEKASDDETEEAPADSAEEAPE